MTDLDAFRRALQACDPPGEAGPGLTFPDSPALNVREIMAKGRWLRRSRRLAAVGGSAFTSISHLSRSSHASAPTPAASAGSPSGPASRVREGQVISSGIRDAGGEVVFWGVRIDLRQLPGTTFGIMAGLRDSSGALTPEVEANETEGSDTAPGFHAAESPSSVGSPAAAIPEFGYYAGPAARITALDGARQVQAATARWSVNPAIVIFWFPPAASPGGAALQNLTAYNAAGHQLPPGNNTPGNG